MFLLTSKQRENSPGMSPKGVDLAGSRLQPQAILGVLELFWRSAASSSFTHSFYPDKFSQSQ